ncbi:MAG: hypothetical protein ACREE0_01430 [Phenylobacterium sp.]
MSKKEAVAAVAQAMAAPAADAVLQAMSGTKAVTIAAAKGITYQANVRAWGAPIPTVRVPGPKWQYALPAGTYVFNVNIVAISGQTVTFAFAGATPTPPASFLIGGTPGQVRGENHDIKFVV